MDERCIKRLCDNLNHFSINSREERQLDGACCTPGEYDKEKLKPSPPSMKNSVVLHSLFAPIPCPNDEIKGTVRKKADWMELAT